MRTIGDADARHLSLSDRAELLELVDTQTFSEGATIVSQYAPSTAMYIILEGEVKLIK